jgi:hypothetical protein
MHGHHHERQHVPNGEQHDDALWCHSCSVAMVSGCLLVMSIRFVASLVAFAVLNRSLEFSSRTVSGRWSAGATCGDISPLSLSSLFFKTKPCVFSASNTRRRFASPFRCRSAYADTSLGRVKSSQVASGNQSQIGLQLFKANNPRLDSVRCARYVCYLAATPRHGPRVRRSVGDFGLILLCDALRRFGVVSMLCHATLRYSTT